MNPDDMTTIAEIIRLHDEAFEHYQKDPCCGGWKSSEGAVSIEFGNYWERDEPPAVSVYSYALGPSRMHHFKSPAEALAAVRQWHKEEMEHDCNDDGWGFTDEEGQ